MGSCSDSHLFDVLGSLIIFTPPLPLPLIPPSALTPSSQFKATFLGWGGGWGAALARHMKRSTGSFRSLFLATCSPIHFTLSPPNSPFHYTLLLHEAWAIDPSDNPVFHIGRLILTQSPGADARPILQVLEHAEYERWSLIYIQLVLLTPEELHDREEVIVVCQLYNYMLRIQPHKA